MGGGSATRPDRLAWAWIGAAAMATAAAYAPGLGGPFLFDDYSNIVPNERLALGNLDWVGLRDAALSSRSGPLGRPLPMASFALNHYVSGLDPFAFKLTNLAIHLFNGFLVFLIARKLVRAAALLAPRRDSATDSWIPGAAAALWLLHPIQLTSVLYVVQRMNSLMALFVLGGLLLYLWGRERLEARPALALAAMGSGIAGGTLLGLACKENAVLLPYLAGLVELVVLRRDELPAKARVRLGCFHALAMGVPGALAIAVLLLRPDFALAGYLDRDFGPLERLLTQGRVLFFYLGLIFQPDLGRLGLYHDDVVPSTGLLEPLSTGVALVAWLALVALAVAGRRRWPVASFAVLWYLVAHAVESSILPLELAFEHRNYLAALGPMLGVAWYVTRFLVPLVSRPGYAAVALVALPLALAVITTARASLWSDARALIVHAARTHPGSPRALVAAAYLNVMDARPLPEVYAGFARAAEVDPAAVDPLVEMAKILAGFAGVPRERRVGANGLPVEEHEIEALSAELRGEVATRLRDYAIGAESMRALVEVQECVRRGVDVCRPLVEAVLGWHEIAVNSRRRSRFAAARLELSLAKLYLFVGRADDAVALAERAATTDVGDIGFQGQLIELYMTLGQWEEAERAAARLESDHPPSGFRGREVLEVRASLERARRAARAPSPGQTTRR